MQRHEITPMAENVLAELSHTPKGDTAIFVNCSGSHTPSSHNGLKRVLCRLVSIGYAKTKQINGRDYWVITELGESHWPSDEEIQATIDRLRSLVAA